MTLEDTKGACDEFSRHLCATKRSACLLTSATKCFHHYLLCVRTGDNPGGRCNTGPPVTLHWDVEASEEYSTIDAFSKHYHGQRDEDKEHFLVPSCVLRVIPSARRREIAVADQNSATMIARTQAEVKIVREARKRAMREALKEMQQAHMKQKQQQQQKLRLRAEGEEPHHLQRKREKKLHAVFRLFGHRRKRDGIGSAIPALDELYSP